MADNDPGYKPGKVEVKECLLYNHKNKVLNITHIFVEFNIFYDLYGKGVKCELVINEAAGLVEFMPLVGDETLVISFKTPTEKNAITHVFRVYSVTDKQKTEQRAESYVIHGISQELINNQRNSVNKSYVDLRGDQIIKSIYNDFLKPTQEDFGIIRKRNTLSIPETEGNLSVVFPGSTPFEAIDYVIQETVAKSDSLSLSSNFQFYESTDGWYLKTLDSLLTQEAVDDFYLTEAAKEQTPDDVIKPHQKISNLNQVKQFDSLQALTQGLYTHTIEIIDPLLKTYTEDTFLYDTDQKNIAHIEGFKKDSSFLLTDNSIFKKESNSATSYRIVSHVGDDYRNRVALFSDAISTDPQIRNPRKLHTFMKYDIASRLQLNNIILEVAIPGNTSLKIGDIVNLHIPQTTQKKDFEKKLNLLYNKRFLITSIRHTYNKTDNHFFTVLECVKDTYGRKVREEQ